MINDSTTNIVYNPDVLSCLANLSNDEVFTPPEIVNKMLDMLPQELFRDKASTFLDPACKSGVFLREIAKRLLKARESEYMTEKDGAGQLKPDVVKLQPILDHIFHKQLFGIAITEITSLLSRRSVYCSKYPNCKYSITQFDDAEGNIRFKKIKHVWHGERCAFCGATKSEYDRDELLETHAYEFIHTAQPEEIFKMKFDVIIGNPPYQLSDGGGTGTSAKPIYQLFIQQAQKLNPRFLSMIIPARWYSGGKGLDSFRDYMLQDYRIKKLVDYENFKDVFPSVDLAGGACYFLWARDYKGACEVVNFCESDSKITTRYLNEYPFFIRHNLAINIVRKITGLNKKFLDQVVSTRLPFGITSTYSPLEGGDGGGGNSLSFYTTYRTKIRK